jgi:DUF4097 and DUF4098 domain-containing protein YvlB
MQVRSGTQYRFLLLKLPLGSACLSHMKRNLAVRSLSLIFGLAWFTLQTGEALAKTKFQAELHETHALSETGQVQLDNVNGNVRITAWDRAEVKVDAIKGADTKEALEALKIEIDAKPDRIRVHTKYPSSKGGWLFRRSRNDSARVDYDLKVPSQASLQKVENVNGNLELEGVRGTIHASTVNGRLTAKAVGGDGHFDTVNGSVEIVVSTLADVKSVSIYTVNGKVDLTLPAKANADVTASTVNGGIHTDPGLSVRRTGPVGSEVKGRLGEGGAKVHAETVNGAIRIHSPAAQPVMVERPE